ncbi:MAG: universal stress protein [Saprospiraceae bacterium]|nr:universal stress protein [Saprospiraceae bacterium]MBK7810961.1 universal stress protein [Saprospiraceae bacterium]MBK9630565.1 universal stress protein [Saprospiraceae bacterium]
MYQIICPIDFSPASENALDYAIEFGKNYSAQIVLLNVFSIPVASADAFVFVPGVDEINQIKNAWQERLDQLILKYESKLNVGMGISGVVRYGEATMEILLLARDLKPNLVILGMQGEGFIKEKIIGSTATRVMAEYEKPILIVPAGCRYHEAKNIVFFYDGQDFNDEHVLSPLVETVESLKSNLAVCTIVPNVEEFPDFQEKLCSSTLAPSLSALSNVSYQIVQSPHFLDAIAHFLSEHPADLIFTVKRKHNFLESLFKTSRAKTLAFHSDIPLLSSLD